LHTIIINLTEYSDFSGRSLFNRKDRREDTKVTKVKPYHSVL